MKTHDKKFTQSGFSLIELLISMTITLILMGAAATLLGGAFSTRARETSRNDAIVSARAALDAMSREIGNSGFGLDDNGIVIVDSNAQRIRFRSNLVNTNSNTGDAGEDVTYFYDSAAAAVLRYDRAATPATTAIINKISTVSFQYFDYDGNSAPVAAVVPSADTGRLRITLTIQLPPVNNQPNNQVITLTSDVTLRNSTYMRHQY